MKPAERLPALGVIVVLVLGGIFVASRFMTPAANALIVDVKVPGLSEEALAGQEAFDANCVQCHGDNGGGNDKGPPLVHNIYKPGHHGDDAFLLAVQRGVKRHHWSFGDMPPQPRVKREEMDSMVRYVRELQTANGIF